jgi:hypothetical protein
MPVQSVVNAEPGRLLQYGAQDRYRLSLRGYRLSLRRDAGFLRRDAGCSASNRLFSS